MEDERACYSSGKTAKHRYFRGAKGDDATVMDWLPGDLTPIKAIRLKCLDCSGGCPSEVRQCELEECPLWPYRMGKRPVFEKETTVEMPVLKGMDADGVSGLVAQVS